MERKKLEDLSYEMVNKILSENDVKIPHGLKDTLYSICASSVILGYQLAHSENLEFIGKKMTEINGELIKNDESKR